MTRPVTSPASVPASVPARTRVPGRAGAPVTRAGAFVSVVLNVLLLYLVNVRPGWDAVPFLSARTPDVLGLVNLSMLAGVAVNLILLVYRARWFAAAGNLIATCAGVAASARVWQVFPFDLPSGWTAPLRVLLAVAVVGGVIGAIVQLVTLIRVLHETAHAT